MTSLSAVPDHPLFDLLVLLRDRGVDDDVLVFRERVLLRRAGVFVSDVADLLFVVDLLFDDFALEVEEALEVLFLLFLLLAACA